ncbi:MAG: 23S rRNA (uracil(1939)-C(5))-methyltransferase RlmD, partial [Candidatus Schmidhempelia sp.]|nr:23S rRNA (uracil(1939)-C(5))-methyltransferase RlmD [Candidatus Schmidhempelia sp.]
MNQLKQVDIMALDAFGQGIAKEQGKTIFVKQALPGEKVDIHLTEEKKQYAKAEVVKRYNQSQLRVQPACRHFGVCGGCQLQHASTTLQQKSKQQALQHLLERDAGVDIKHLKIDVIAADSYAYRRRARLALRMVKDRLVMGFRKENSNDIVNIEMCPVLMPKLANLIQPLRNTLNSLTNKRALGHVEIVEVESGIVIVLRHIKPLSEQDQQQLFDFAKRQQLSVYLHGETLVQLTQNDDPYYYIEELKLTFSPLDFIQVNQKVNQKMVAKALDWLALTDSDCVLDLFCGMGNFSLPIAKFAKQVVGIEGVKALVEKATTNVVINQQRNKSQRLNASFYQHDLDNLNNHVTWLHTTPFNKILLDPARSGALNMVKQIVSMTCSTIIYISCNPATLARDSKILLDAGYKI